MNSAYLMYSLLFYFTSLRAELQPSFLRSCFMPLPLLFYWSLLPKGQTFKWIQFLSPNDWAAGCVPRDTSQCWLTAAVDRLVLRDVVWGLCLPTAIPRHNCPWPAQRSSPCSNHRPVLQSTTLPRSHLHRNHHSFPLPQGEARYRGHH